MRRHSRCAAVAHLCNKQMRRDQTKSMKKGRRTARGKEEQIILIKYTILKSDVCVSKGAGLWAAGG